jgi:signal transduction histidine kinase/CheY-like chemotaxis protein
VSIRAKLLSLIIVASFTAALIVTGVSVWRDATRFTEGKRGEIRAMAQVFSSAAAEAVKARSQGEAARVLRAIARIPGVLTASILLPDGRPLAAMGESVRLVREDTGDKGGGFSAFIDILSQTSIEEAVPVISGGETIGTLKLVADTSQIADNALQSLINAGLAGLIAMLAGFLFAFRIQQSIARRITTMTAAMDHVRLRHDFTRRIEGRSNDELDTIALGFNAMLDEVQLRDARLAEHRDNLEREVAERTQDYRLAKENADAANAAKSDFLATMSHEIRTPMNGILVMAELLAASDLQPKQKRFADVIARSGSSLLAIINDILDFSKIEAGKIELEQIPVSLDDMIETVAQLFEEKARSKGLDLSTHIAPTLPARITADPVRLNQILSNLVNNALKFTEAGGVNLRVSRDPERPNHMLFAVEDSGIGIAADKIDTVFEAFSQADQTTTRKFGGTGLGLAICKRLVDSMDGAIFIRSEIGRGTTFFVSIPILHADRLGSAPALARHGPGRVLLAVSGQMTTANLTAYLTELGFEVADPIAETLSPGGGDIKLIVAEAALLADPGIRPLLRRAPTIAIGAFGDSETDRVVEQGLAQGQVIKPISRRELQQVIGDVLAGRSTKRSSTASANEMPRYPGHLVLVADDNPVNREVIIETLRRFDLPCDTVVDGRAAIEAVKAKPYDLVFMDGSMPDIDGFEATVAIRAWEKESGRFAMPIVALTAHVVGAHADAWKASGMNAVLHKPFTLQAMADTLLAHLPPEPVKRSGVDPRAIPEPIFERIPLPEAGPRAQPADEIVADVVAPITKPPATLHAETSSAGFFMGLSVEAGLQGDPILEPGVTRQLLDMARMGGASAVARIYRLYLENGPPALEEISQAVAASDLPRTGRAAHALKSMSLSLGAQRVSALTSELEKAARGDAHPFFAELRDRIAGEMDLAYRRIRQLMQEEELEPEEPQAEADRAKTA